MSSHIEVQGSTVNRLGCHLLSLDFDWSQASIPSWLRDCMAAIHSGSPILSDIACNCARVAWRFPCGSTLSSEKSAMDLVFWEYVGTAGILEEWRIDVDPSRHIGCWDYFRVCSSCCTVHIRFLAHESWSLARRSHSLRLGCCSLRKPVLVARHPWPDRGLESCCWSDLRQAERAYVYGSTSHQQLDRSHSKGKPHQAFSVPQVRPWSLLCWGDFLDSQVLSWSQEVAAYGMDTCWREVYDLLLSSLRYKFRSRMASRRCHSVCNPSGVAGSVTIKSWQLSVSLLQWDLARSDSLMTSWCVASRRSLLSFAW